MGHGCVRGALHWRALCLGVFDDTALVGGRLAACGSTFPPTRPTGLLMAI